MRREEYAKLMGFEHPATPDKRQALLAFAGLALLAVLATMTVMLITLDVRADLLTAAFTSLFAAKIILCLFIAVASILILYSALQPGGRPLWYLLVMPLAMLAGGVAWNLAATPVSGWSDLLLDGRARFCMAYIGMLAVPAFIILSYAVRLFRVRDAGKIGALTGLAAGAIGALAFAFHCANDYPVFLLLTYAPSIALVAWAGSRIGPVMARRQPGDL